MITVVKQLKCYINQGYLIVEVVDENVYGEGLSKDARVNRHYATIPDGRSQIYSFTNVNNVLENYCFRNGDGDVMFLDADGEPFADEAAFQTFYLANTGKSSGGDTPTLNSFISDDEDNSLQLGGDSKLFSKLPNIAISYSISAADYDLPHDYFFNYFAYTGVVDSVFRLPVESGHLSKSYTIVNQSATKTITVLAFDGSSAIIIDGVAYIETTIAPKQILTLVNIDGKFYKP